MSNSCKPTLTFQKMNSGYEKDQLLRLSGVISNYLGLAPHSAGLKITKIWLNYIKISPVFCVSESHKVLL